MNRNSREITDEILHRAAAWDRRYMNKKRKIYISLSFAACFALITALSIFISSLSSKTTALDTNVKHSAVLFSGGAAGGYVLIGVIGFILGAAVTLLCIKNKKD